MLPFAYCLRKIALPERAAPLKAEVFRPRLPPLPVACSPREQMFMVLRDVLIYTFLQSDARCHAAGYYRDSDGALLLVVFF